MAANGVNAVRTYTVPPRWLLDLAHEHGLWVMVGLPWEQHVTFLDDRGPRRGDRAERAGDRCGRCAGHPAILCYAIGNEIPASIVRWHGRRRIERFLRRLYDAAKREDPDALVTYVNYPSTEYLQLPFIDLVCFNVFLESGPQFESYLARLQNIAGDRPLLVTEAGLDSLRNSEEAQARALDWQVRTAFAGRLRRDVRVLLDRRVAPRRLRHRRLGVRPGGPRPRARSRRSPRSARPSPRRRSAPDPDWPRDLGGRVRLQQRGHAAQLLRRPARARLPGLRGDRRQRRLDRRAPTRSRRSTASA